MTATVRPTAGALRRAGALPLAVLFAAEFLVMLDGMVVSVALPAIQRDLAISTSNLQWVVTAYTVSLGAFLLVGGRAADRVGRRRMLTTGLALFAAASLAAAVARAPWLLLSARALAGLGAALALPAALGLLTASIPEGRRRDRALGYMSATIDVAMVTGAVLGGVITFALGWPWIFFLVGLAAAVALALTQVVIEDVPGEHRTQRLDVLGSALLATGIGVLILSLTNAEQDGPTAGSTLLAAAGAAALLAAFVAVERRASTPLLNLEWLRSRRLAGANLAIVTNAGAFVGVVVLGTLYMQRALGFSALETGLGFLPLAVSAGLGGPAAAPLIARFRPWRVVAVSQVVTAAMVVWIALASGSEGYWAGLLPAYAIAGFTFATAAVPLTAEATAEASSAEKGTASGLFQTSTHVGGAVVLAVLVVVFAASGLETALLIAAAILAAGAVIAVALLRDGS